MLRVCKATFVRTCHYFKMKYTVFCMNGGYIYIKNDIIIIIVFAVLFLCYRMGEIGNQRLNESK